MQIVDTIYPVTKEDNRCGIKKATKFRQRAALIKQIAYYKEDKNNNLPKEIKDLIDEDLQSRYAY